MSPRQDLCFPRPCARTLRLLLAWILCAYVSLCPANPAAPPDIQRILTRGALIVAIPTFDSPPFFSGQGDGLHGLDIDLAQGIAASLGVRLRIVRHADTFDGVLDQVAGGEADVAICNLSRTLARARRIRFSDPYLTFKHALAINRLSFAHLAGGRDLDTVIRHFTGKIGVIGGSSFADYAARNFPTAQVVPFPDWAAVVEALKRGEVTAAYRDEFEIERLFKTDPKFALAARMVTLSDLEDSLGLAVAPGSYQLLALINLYLAQRPDKLTTEKALQLMEGAGN